MNLTVIVGQLEIAWDPAGNSRRVIAFLDAEAVPGSLVVLPEAVLSGYDDELSGLPGLDVAELAAGRHAVAAVAGRLGLHVLCGSLLPDRGGWCNAGLYFGPSGERWIYRKVNLATHERGRLTAGSALPVLELRSDRIEPGVAVGVQLCRELRFPEQWHVLAAEGATILAYLTYAANPRLPGGVWRSHLISRAAETQRFVVAANVAHQAQHCPSMVILPSGAVLAESTSTEPQALRADLDLSLVGDSLLAQQRADVVSVKYLRPGEPADGRIG